MREVEDLDDELELPHERQQLARLERSEELKELDEETWPPSVLPLGRPFVHQCRHRPELQLLQRSLWLQQLASQLLVEVLARIFKAIFKPTKCYIHYSANLAS